MTPLKVTAKSVAVEHITIASSLTFAEVRRKLEAVPPNLDRTIVEDLSCGDKRKAQYHEQIGPKLSIFLTRDHGALPEAAGGARNAIQYDIGNIRSQLRR